MIRAGSLAGMTFAELARICNKNLPDSLLKAKGFVGQLLEEYLGATAGVKSLPDFIELGVELKTLPLNANFIPKETTYVCTVPGLDEILNLTFENSRLFHKLKQVLWVPFEADAGIPLDQRKIASPFLWTPSPSDLSVLRHDFEEIIDFISFEGLHAINAKLGTYLQVRPKAANSQVQCRAFDSMGQMSLALPRGFYLRTKFTHKVLKEYFGT